MENLRYLNLSHGGFRGTIPHQLGNLSHLQYLDLKFLNFMSSRSLHWAAGLSSLQFLGLSWVDLSGATDLLQVTSRLPSLQQLHLSSCNCNLPHNHTTTPLPPMNFSSLSVLDLSVNSLSLVPGWIFTLPALTALSLQGNNLVGPIPAGIQNLTGLTYLDLRNCQLTSSIPGWLFGLYKLEYLNLRSNSLQGRIPFPGAIANTTSLTYLDFSENQLTSSLPKWLFDLNNLEHLNLGSNSLQGPIPEAIGNMTSLTGLDFSKNQLTSSLPKGLFDLNNLEDLSLRRNSLQGPIPEAIGNMSSLANLDFSDNRELECGDSLLKLLGGLCRLTEVDFSGIKISDLKSLSGCIRHGLADLSLEGAQLSGQFSDLVDHFAEFKNLASLDLTNNSLHGPIPDSIGRLVSLQALRIGQNQLNGSLPESLGGLLHLQLLDTSSNPMTGDVTEVHFANLTELRQLLAVDNKFNLKVTPKWVPPFQLEVLQLDSWQIGPRFPPWLRSQNSLFLLSMSRTGISSTLPSWFWNSFPRLVYLNLSGNQIHGNLNESSTILPRAQIIYLSSNQFSGGLPLISPNLAILSLSNNFFHESISHFLCHKGQELKQLEYLDLQSNRLVGELPDCWTNWASLTDIRLGNNEFTGNVPSSIGFLHELKLLHLENNHLQGEFPTFLGNCKLLLSIDLGGNNFAGRLPTWMGEKLASMKILKLRSNRFHGQIPDQICALMSLQVLDLAHNNLFGSIPKCFNRFTAMAISQKNTSITIETSHQSFNEVMLLMWKGITSKYDRILGLMVSIDLSSNNFSGDIPEELMSLVGMRSLNLSKNFLTGKIPNTISVMQSLEIIDFSHNQISGQIPFGLSSLTFLNYLDLSYNNLEGQIPSSTQLQSFAPDRYVGNKLCGPPLTNNCSTKTKVKSEQGYKEDAMETCMIYGSMAMGFVVGFWIVWGLLLFNKSWRLAYFTFLESLFDKICHSCSDCS